MLNFDGWIAFNISQLQVWVWNMVLMVLVGDCGWGEEAALSRLQLVLEEGANWQLTMNFCDFIVTYS